MTSFLPLTIEDQIAAMRRDWPTFALSRREGGNIVVWRGKVKPYNRPYVIEIFYSLDLVIAGPVVRVLFPALTRLPGNAEGSLPHVYDRDTDPVLCLFDPAKREWDGWKEISRTTVPWSIDWLSCYEFWLMTGEWHGGGRHPPSSGDRFNVESAA